jgi:hypothetical protein
MSIWEKVEDDFYILDSIDAAGIKKAEEELGVILPTSYKKLMLEQNGGSIKLDTHPSPVPTVWGDDYVKLDALMGIGESGGILESAYFIGEWGMPKDLVLLHGDGHEWIALDYRERKENPPVIFIDNEAEQIVELAPDFETFVKGLYYVDEASEDIEVDYEPMPTYSEGEIIEKIQSDDVVMLIDCIHMMSYSYDQKFVFEQYIGLTQHPRVEVREAVASQLYSLISLDEITQMDLLKKLIRHIFDDKDENIKGYAKYIEEGLGGSPV